MNKTIVDIEGVIIITGGEYQIKIDEDADSSILSLTRSCLFMWDNLLKHIQKYFTKHGWAAFGEIRVRNE